MKQSVKKQSVWIRKFTDRYLIKGLGGMAAGLFCTLIIGLILKQIGGFIPETTVGQFLISIGQVAGVLTGIGIAIGTAHSLGAPKLVLYSSAINGVVGAYAVQLATGKLIVDGAIQLIGPGDPLAAFVAAVVGLEVGMLVAGKTKLDILITPAVTIGAGTVTGIVLGPYFSQFTTLLGETIQYATELQPFLMGIVISVLMGIFLTLPISSAAIGIILGLSGIAAGAATAGCAAQMVGFAVMSYKENGMNGLLAQGLGTSMLQMPNIVRNPKVWIPPIVASIVTGPLATIVFKMENVPAGSGMGTSGLVGPLLTWETMRGTAHPTMVALGILLLHFVLPALITLVVAAWMRKKKWIKDGDLKLEA